MCDKVGAWMCLVTSHTVTSSEWVFTFYTLIFQVPWLGSNCHQINYEHFGLHNISTGAVQYRYGGVVRVSNERVPTATPKQRTQVIMD